MIKWPGRRSETPQEMVGVPEQLGAQPIDPHAFIAAHEPMLIASAEAWQGIAQKSKVREDGYVEHIRQGLIDVWEANSNGAPLPEDRILDRDTEKLATDLSVYCLMAARHFSTEINLGLNNRIKEHFLHIPDHTVNYIIRSKGFPTTKFMLRQIWMAMEIADANDKAASVLHGLTHTYQDRPDDITAIAALYEDGVDEIDGRYAELKEIVSVDWYHPDPEQSMLRGFCRRLRAAPHAYVPEFVSMVAGKEHGNRWATVRGMARFAIIANGGNPEASDAVQTTLARTYDRWGEIQDIDSLFQTFVDGKVTNLEKQFSVIAGSNAVKNIRAFPTAEQIDNFKDFFTVSYNPDRRSRRKAARTAIRTHRADLLPDARSIEKAASMESPRERAPRHIMVAVNTGRGWELEDLSPAEVPQRFNISDSVILERDVQKMVEWLQLNPISAASERIKSDIGMKIILNRVPVKLWRFAPNRVPEVDVHPNNKYWRVVYGLVKGGLILTDILDHDAFDKKYK